MSASLAYAGVVLGLSGLVVIFGVSSIRTDETAWGVAAIVAAVHLHSASTVWMKRIDAGLPPLSASSGALMVGVPLYLLTWLCLDGEWPDHVPARAVGSIAYLGVVGSVAGSVLFFHVLKHVEASKLGLVPLITPTLALPVGASVAGETVAPSTLVGGRPDPLGPGILPVCGPVVPAPSREGAPAPRVEEDHVG
ncbi:MAG: DMT family transporter [Gammaproteobacteria bacterium]|nr:DMT family transporter [Gammaproteobacteria bacterium]NIR31080.1 DMT family transporter [Gammaproteobacteria bacterium]NIR98535.1 DMT family transporter [Gammaproteobacteria bacterium]NIT64257.1 DMT family transporter [Gammaproteobacteria bacterium]NIV21862.1 EamA family transporter [Gammaproteobacteria bacterium]